MASLNSVTLIGHLGRDPEVRTFANGGKVCSLRIATSESWRDRQTGERRELTEWHTVQIQNEGLVGIAEKYLRKGSQVLVSGKLRTRKWQDQGGADRYSTEIVLGAFDAKLLLLDRREGSADPASDTPPPHQSSSAPGGRHDLDDEIPF